MGSECRRGSTPGLSGKGGEAGKRELPRPAFEATCIWLECLGKDLTMMRPDESLWPDTRGGRGITSGTFYTNLRCYLKNAGLPSGGVHIFRHSAAQLHRDDGESVEDVSRFLDHSSLAVTTTYLRRLEGQEDQSWVKVAEGRSGSSLSMRPASSFTSSKLSGAMTETADAHVARQPHSAS